MTFRPFPTPPPLRALPRFLSAALAVLAVLHAVAGSAPPARAQSAAAEAAASELWIETRQGRRVHFTVELALTPEQQSRGLMFRESMPPDAGMLFVFDSVRPVAFWMKNTPLPLDMLFIGADGRIVNIAARTTPFSTAQVPSAGPVRAVLEINGGVSALLGIAPGDRVIHPALGS